MLSFKNNFVVMNKLLDIIQDPFTEKSSMTKYSLSLKKEIVPYTFCGT